MLPSKFYHAITALAGRCPIWLKTPMLIRTYSEGPGCGGVYRKNVRKKFPNWKEVLYAAALFDGNLALKMKKMFPDPAN